MFSIINLNNRIFVLLELFLTLIGLCIFAWFIHGDRFSFIIAMGGLILASSVISRAIIKSDSLLSVFGLDHWNKKIIIYCSIGIFIGIILALVSRYVYKLSFIPGTLTFVAFASPLIGMTEELIFRGYMQGRLRKIHIISSIYIAAASHTLYKFLVLRSLPDGIRIHFFALITLTFGVGILLGYLRELSGNALPAMIMHATFDIVLYGDFTEMPEWVWG